MRRRDIAARPDAEPTTPREPALVRATFAALAGTEALTAAGPVFVVETVAEVQTMAHEADSTAPTTKAPQANASVLELPPKENLDASGRDTMVEEKAGMMIATCSSVTSDLATRRFVRDAPSMGTQLNPVACLTVSTVSTAVVTSRRSAPARLDPSGHLLA